jgi:hypothetical protein
VNVFNRLILFLVALILIAVPVLLLLVTSGAVAAETVNSYTGYQSGVQSLQELAQQSPDSRGQIIIGIAGAIVALIGLLLFLGELTPRRRQGSRWVSLEVEPDQQTTVTSTAVRSLVEGAAREAGAGDSSVSLKSHRHRYTVLCNVPLPGEGSLSEFASGVRQNVQRVLGEQHVPVESVEVNIQRAKS